MNSFLSFADCFLDGIIADCIVQKKIDDARRQIDDGIRNVELLLGSLKSQKGEWRH